MGPPIVQASERERELQKLNRLKDQKTMLSIYDLKYVHANDFSLSILVFYVRSRCHKQILLYSV